MKERVFIVLMRELCEEEGIKFEKLSYDLILQLSKDGKVRHIIGNRFDLNPEAAGRIACDKYATYEVLSSQNIPVIKHVMVFNPETNQENISNGGVWSKIITEFLNDGCLVVKPNDGSEGRDVSLCKTLKEVECEVERLFKTNKSLSICPYYDIETEYRAFYLNGEIHLVYGKNKPFVIGDGKSSLKKLIESLNLPKKKSARDNLSKLDMEYVPKAGERFELSWKHNLSGGATPQILEKGELYTKIADLATMGGKAMNMKFATIDVIHTTDNKLYIMEVNSGVCTNEFIKSVENGREIIKDIYRKAIREMFL